MYGAAGDQGAAPMSLTSVPKVPAVRADDEATVEGEFHEVGSDRR